MHRILTEAFSNNTTYFRKKINEGHTEFAKKSPIFYPFLSFIIVYQVNEVLKIVKFQWTLKMSLRGCYPNNLIVKKSRRVSLGNERLKH